MNCPHCKNKISILITKHKSLYRTGKITGRPRVADPEVCQALHKKGFSLQGIATELGISKGAVQYALRNKNK